MTLGGKNIQVANKYLQIQGFVDKEVLSELLGKSKFTKPNTYWVFIDYSPQEFKLNSKFDIILEGEDKKMSPHFYNIKLLTVLDQFGNHLESLQEGWKTICRLEFLGNLPTSFKMLPVLQTWKHNKDNVKIANHKDLVIDTNNISTNVYSQVFRELLSLALNTDKINKKEFLSSMKNIYMENSDEMSEKIPLELFNDAERELHEMESV